MANNSNKKDVSSKKLGSSDKQSDRDKSQAMELVENLLQLYKLQGVLLDKLQDKIKKMKTL